MTSFGMLSGVSSSQTTDGSSNIFSKAIENAGATVSSNATSTSASTSETDAQYKQQVMSNMGIGTGLDVSA